ncbi:MAG: hypothetical protein Kow00109_07770 [Acidobacteriota bacterium]
MEIQELKGYRLQVTGFRFQVSGFSDIGPRLSLLRDASLHARRVRSDWTAAVSAVGSITRETRAAPYEPRNLGTSELRNLGSPKPRNAETVAPIARDAKKRRLGNNGG